MKALKRAARGKSPRSLGGDLSGSTVSLLIEEDEINEEVDILDAKVIQPWEQMPMQNKTRFLFSLEFKYL